MGNPDPRVNDGKTDHGAIAVRLLGTDPDLDASLVCELDRIGAEVDQDLLDPLWIAFQIAAALWFDETDELEVLVGRARCDQFAHAAHDLVEIDGDLLHLEPARLDFRKIEDVVDHGQKRLGRAADRTHVAFLFHIEPCVVEETAHPDDGVHRRTDLVAHVGKKLALRPGARLGRLLGFVKRALALLELHHPAELIGNRVEKADLLGYRRRLSIGNPLDGTDLDPGDLRSIGEDLTALRPFRIAPVARSVFPAAGDDPRARGLILVPASRDDFDDVTEKFFNGQLMLFGEAGNGVEAIEFLHALSEVALPFAQTEFGLGPVTDLAGELPGSQTETEEPQRPEQSVTETGHDFFFLHTAKERRHGNGHAHSAEHGADRFGMTPKTVFLHGKGTHEAGTDLLAEARDIAHLVRAGGDPPESVSLPPVGLIGRIYRFETRDPRWKPGTAVLELVDQADHGRGIDLSEFQAERRHRVAVG